MILLDAVVEIPVAAMSHLVTERLADGTGRGIMPIGRDPLWGMTYNVNSLRRSKRLVAALSRFSAPHGITQIPIAITGPIQRAPFPAGR